MNIKKLLRPGWIVFNLCLLTLLTLIVSVLYLFYQGRVVASYEHKEGIDMYSAAHDPFGGGGYRESVLPHPISEPVQVTGIIRRNLSVTTEGQCGDNFRMGFLIRRSIFEWSHRGRGSLSYLEKIGHISGLYSFSCYRENKETIEPVGDELISALAEAAPNLRHLEIIDSTITDQGMQTIANTWPELQSLVLRSSRLTDRSAQSLKKLAHLNTLVIKDCEIGQRASVAISGMSNLTELDLENTQIELSDLLAGGTLPALHNFSFKAADLNSDERLPGIVKFAPNLSMLSLDGQGVTDNDLKQILKLPNLYDVSLRGSRISDESLNEILGSKVYFMGLESSNISKSGLEKVKKHNENVHGSMVIG